MKLDHPFVVKMNYALMDEEKIYFLFEHLEGGSFFYFIRGFYKELTV